MSEYPLSYREVIPDQSVTEIWKEISLNTGGTQSVLQDIKSLERADGFCYKDSSQHFTRNRFIYWRINNDILELIEHSLDIDLAGNRVRYKFIDTPLLDGISIHETVEHVIVLVPTVCSVHRLVYPHPRNFHKSDDLLGIHSLSARSIFADANDVDALNASSFYVFSGPSSANSLIPKLASSTLHLGSAAIFILVYSSGELLLVHQTEDGQNYSTELKQDSIVPRFLSGLAEKLRSKTNDGDHVISLVLHSVHSETYAITLTRDAHLKFWSCTKMQCVAVLNILMETGDYPSNSQGTQNHILHKAVNGENENCILAIFLTNQNQLHIFKPIFEMGQIRIVRLHSLYSPENDLIDMSLTTSRIWSVWRCGAFCKVYTTCLPEDVREWTPMDWTAVVLEELPENPPPLLDSEADPSHIYLQYIFHPGRFPLHVINKALNTYQRSAIVSELNLTPASLKKRIASAVHNEIQMQLKQTEVSYDDYLQSASWCWERFYSCCEQYNAAGLKPLGIFLLHGVSGAVLLKKSAISFLRPLDTLEYMLLCSDSMFDHQFLQQGGLSEDVDVIPDVVSLMQVVVYLNAQTSEMFGYTFEHELSQLRLPDVVMSELIDKIQTELDKEFISQVAKRLNECRDLYQAIHKLMELVRDAHRFIDDDEKKCENTLAYLFTSQLGVSMVTHCLRQQAQARFMICRNLLLIINILLKRQELPWEILEAVRSVCSPEIVVLTQASYVIYWLSGLPALPAVSDETIKKRLAPMKLAPVFNVRNSHQQVMSILALFIGSRGGQVGHNKFAHVKNYDQIHHWQNSLLPYLSHLFQIIWPISGCPILAEWLLSSGQHIWLQQYVRLLKKWCEWNSCTRNFLLGCSFLITKENYKARLLFESAAKGIFTDAYLAQKILKNSSDEDATRAHVTYYLKVIQLFELNNADDIIIQLANTALCVVNSEDPMAATLYSIKFKYNLRLRRYAEAYNALNSNPDEERKRDNLRDLVKSLLDAREYEALMTFNYGELEELLHEILLSRARSTEPEKNDFYDLLYVYHVKRGPTHFHKAGSVIYERASRFNPYRQGASLEKQIKCYLAAMNILRLCDKKSIEILRPKDTLSSSLLIRHSPPKKAVLEDHPEVEVVSLEDIKKEFEFAHAKKELCHCDYNNYIRLLVSTPEELVVALCTSNMYKTALRLSKFWDMKYEMIFEHFTERCVRLSCRRNPQPPDWKWLSRNKIRDLTCLYSDPKDIAWLFLKMMLEEYEEPGLTSLHKVVTKKILDMSYPIPYWLWASYKVNNAAELLRLLHRSGKWNQAVEVAGGYMLAMMGHGKEYYGLDTSMSPTGYPLWCPTNDIQKLILDLQKQIKNGKKGLSKELRFIKGLYENYAKTAVRISKEMERYKLALYNNAVACK